MLDFNDPEQRYQIILAEYEKIGMQPPEIDDNAEIKNVINKLESQLGIDCVLHQLISLGIEPITRPNNFLFFSTIDDEKYIAMLKAQLGKAQEDYAIDIVSYKKNLSKLNKKFLAVAEDYIEIASESTEIERDSNMTEQAKLVQDYQIEFANMNSYLELAFKKENTPLNLKHLNKQYWKIHDLVESIQRKYHEIKLLEQEKVLLAQFNRLNIPVRISRPRRWWFFPVVNTEYLAQLEMFFRDELNSKLKVDKVDLNELVVNFEAFWMISEYKAQFNFVKKEIKELEKFLQIANKKSNGKLDNKKFTIWCEKYENIQMTVNFFKNDYQQRIKLLQSLKKSFDIFNLKIFKNQKNILEKKCEELGVVIENKVERESLLAKFNEYDYSDLNDEYNWREDFNQDEYNSELLPADSGEKKRRIIIEEIQNLKLKINIAFQTFQAYWYLFYQNIEHKFFWEPMRAIKSLQVLEIQNQLFNHVVLELEQKYTELRKQLTWMMTEGPAVQKLTALGVADFPEVTLPEEDVLLLDINEEWIDNLFKPYFTNALVAVKEKINQSKNSLTSLVTFCKSLDFQPDDANERSLTKTEKACHLKIKELQENIVTFYCLIQNAQTEWNEKINVTIFEEWKSKFEKIDELIQKLEQQYLEFETYGKKFREFKSKIVVDGKNILEIECQALDEFENVNDEKENVLKALQELTHNFKKVEKCYQSKTIKKWSKQEKEQSLIALERDYLNFKSKMSEALLLMEIANLEHELKTLYLENLPETANDPQKYRDVLKERAEKAGELLLERLSVKLEELNLDLERIDKGWYDTVTKETEKKGCVKDFKRSMKKDPDLGTLFSHKEFRKKMLAPLLKRSDANQTQIESVKQKKKIKLN